MIARITLILAILLSMTDTSSCRCSIEFESPMSEATHSQQSCPNCGTSPGEQQQHQGHVDRCCCPDVVGTLPNETRRLLPIDSRLAPADLPRSTASSDQGAANANPAATSANGPPSSGGRALLLRTHRLLI